MIQMTLAQLESLDACSLAKEAFAERFPEGASYRDLLLALADHPEGVEWWMWLAARFEDLKPAWGAYRAATKSARDDFYAATQLTSNVRVAAIKPARYGFWAAARAAIRSAADLV